MGVAASDPPPDSAQGLQNAAALPFGQCRRPFIEAVAGEAESFGIASINAMRRPSPSSETARLAPTIPPPTMACRISRSRGRRQALRPPIRDLYLPVADRSRTLGAPLVTQTSHVILRCETHDVPEYPYRRRDDGQNVDASSTVRAIPGFEHAPFAAHFVIADVVHVDCPASDGAVIEECLVRPSSLTRRVKGPLRSPILTRPCVITRDRSFMRLIPMVPGCELVDGRRLRIEYHLVYGALRRVKRPRPERFLVMSEA